MRFPKLPRLIREEIISVPLPKFIEKLLPTYNSLIDNATNVLTNNVSMRDNLAGQYYEFNDVNGSYLKKLTLSYNRKDQPMEIRLCALRRAGGSSSALPSSGIGQYSYYATNNFTSDFVECDGRSLLIVEYPELYAVIGDSFNTQTNPTNGSVWSSPGTGRFRVPDNRGLYLRGAGLSARMVSGAGTLAKTVVAGQVEDDMTARNGLTGAATTSASANTGNNSVGHTHTFSATSGNNSVGHTHSGTTVGGGGHFHETGFAYASNPFGQGANYNPLGTAASNTPYTAARTSSVVDHAHSFTTGGNNVNHTHAVSGTTAGISANHTHAFSVTMTPLLSSGNIETNVRNRGAICCIQVKSSASKPSIDVDWLYNGEFISCSISGVIDDVKYNCRLFVQA